VRYLRERGFTLLELMVVIGIILILMGVATPSLFRAIRSYQLESSGRQIANLILRARYEAMQRNRRVCTAFVRVAGEARYFIDLTGTDPEPCDDGAPTVNPGEPYTVTSATAQWYNNDNPTLPPLTGLPPGYNTPATAVAPANYRVTFSPRGTVVVPAGGGTWSLPTQVQMICLIRRVPGEFDAVLVTVTPVGRIKLYRWRVASGQWREM